MGEAAARLDDPIAHTSALTGFLVGAVIGIALIAAVAFATFTCGFGVALLAGLAAGIGASAILGIGEAIGKMFSSPSGKIILGSPNVYVNLRNSAYVQGSTVACDKHSPTPLVAEGSTNVFINSLPAARKGDAITCGAKIDDGSKDTFIGGGSKRYLPVDDEVPPWLRTTVDWAFAIAGLVGGLAGLLKAAGGFSKALLPCAAKFTAGFVLGEAAGRYVIGPTVQRAMGGLFGHPVDVTTGRKLLLASDEVDYVLQAPLPLEIGRFYASNLATDESAPIGALGRGWVLPWELRLTRRDGRLWLRDAQGRESGFPLVMPGHSAFHEAEQKYLACTLSGRYILYDLNEVYYDFGEMDEGVGEDVVHLQRIEDRCGQWLTFQRSSDQQRVERIESSGGTRLRLSYLNAQGRLTKIEVEDAARARPARAPARRERVVEYRYDDQGHLQSVIDAQGHETRQFAYAEGLMVSHRQALGFTCSYEWQVIGGQPRVVVCSTSTGERATIQYDLEARSTSLVDELDRRATWRYDANFQVTECIDLDGSLYRMQYNAAGQPTQLELPAEADQPRIVELIYDEAGRIVAETDPLGRVTSTRYHFNSMRPAEVALPGGATWRAEYDHLGRLLATTDPLERVERHRYPEHSLSPRPITRIDARGGEKQLQWNPRGLLTSFTDCSGRTTRYDYDFHGHLASVTNALDQTVRFDRLADGQALNVHLPDGSSEAFEYDALGLLVQHRDRAGHMRAWQRNSRGQPVMAVDANERRLRYDYDPQGRLITLQSGEQDEAAGDCFSYCFSYDAGDRLIAETRPDGIERHLGYGAFGQVIEEHWLGSAQAEARPERRTHFRRDLMSRLLARNQDTSVATYMWSDADLLLSATVEPTEAGAVLGVNASTVAFTYDKAGRLLAEQGRDGTVGYELDELDNLQALSLPQGQRIDYLSYGSGHVHQVRCGDELVADIERDELHREVVRTQGRLSLGLGYDTLGRRTWQSAGSDAQALGPSRGKLWRTYRYSAEGELAEQADSTRGALQFQYDAAGQLLQRSRPAGPDGRKDLEQFAWDAAGNLLDDIQRKSGGRGRPGGSAGRVHGNRLLVWQDIRLDYDAWGNLKSKTSGNRQTQHFSFDADNRLIAVKTISRRGTVQTRFEYDALGRRIAVTDKHVELSGVVSHEQVRRFVWQGLRMVQEQRGSGLSSYVYSPDSPYTPMARVDAYTGPMPEGSTGKPKSRVLHFHTDLVGAPLEVTDSEGELAWAGDYSAWGKVDAERTITAKIEQPLRFAGQYEDSSTGLHFNTFRYYDPELGRFISQDPIGLAGGDNLYGYVPNPSGWMDPLGWCGTSANTGKAVVLGEGMGGVKSAAKQLQATGVKAKWYQAWSKNFPARRMTPQELDSALARNERWIRDKIAKDYKLYDIGIDPRRVDRSPFYELEQRIVKELGATTVSTPRP
jgi:RHS repeat-associated protein